jgi:hypothetical protein
MSSRIRSIVVLLARGVTPRVLFGPGTILPSCYTILPWSRLGEERPSPGRIDAILYPVERRSRVTRERLSRLRRLAPRSLLLPYRIGRCSARTVDRGAACGILTAPLDPSLIEALVCRERRIVEFRQRARNASARTREREERLRSFAAIVRATGRELDPHRIIDLAMGEVHRFLKPRAWLFLLVDPDVGLLTIEKTVGEGLGGQAGRKIGVGEGVAGRAAQRRRTVLVEEIDLRGANAIAPELPTDLEPRSVIAVPLLSRGRVIGVVEVVDMQARHQLRASDARLLALLLEPAAVAIDNALLLRKSEELSITDDLTRLHNSRFLNTTLRREVERSKRYSWISTGSRKSTINTATCSAAGPSWRSVP